MDSHSGSVTVTVDRYSLLLLRTNVINHSTSLDATSLDAICLDIMCVNVKDDDTGTDETLVDDRLIGVMGTDIAMGITTGMDIATAGKEDS